jgi:D-serine deaminase-like pyridoxal phosphate-dependent protein
MIEMGQYKVADPDALETPAMLVYEEVVDHNIRVLCDLVGGGENLMVHVKTHKAEAVARKQVEAGIAGFKCATLSELEMALAAGGKEVILAYPLAQRIKVERFAELAQKNAEAIVCAIVSQAQHVELLGAVAQQRNQTLQVMIDLDVGMHRTGVEPGEDAIALYKSVVAHPQLEARGLHAYDGHDHFADENERAQAAQRNIEATRSIAQRLQSEGLAVPRIVGGGSFSFAYYARAEGMCGSPGTCIYWDTGYADAMPDMPFKWAALVLAQVVDVHFDPQTQAQTITTDLGHKAICGDIPLNKRARLLQNESAELVGQHEEHGVFSWQGELPAIGSYVLAVPGHVCPTTIRYPGSYVLDAEGQVVDYYPHTARDRQ